MNLICSSLANKEDGLNFPSIYLQTEYNPRRSTSHTFQMQRAQGQRRKIMQTYSTNSHKDDIGPQMRLTFLEQQQAFCQKLVAFEDKMRAFEARCRDFRAWINQKKHQRETLVRAHMAVRTSVAVDLQQTGSLVCSPSPHMGELTDAQWKHIATLLNTQRGRGRPRADARCTINGILYVFITKCPWRQIPKRYGSYRRARKTPVFQAGDGSAVARCDPIPVALDKVT